MLSLIPKIPAPSTVKDFRSIACCNMVHKCVNKILANRIQSVLPSLITSSQSAFVKGLSIVDNILLMQEIVKVYHRLEGRSWCAIKMDL